MEKQAGARCRLRLRYRKAGVLRFLSHLEMSRAIERAVRSERLPVAFSSGFHPHPRISFGTALPVGWSGEEEYFELRLTEEVSPERVVGALNASLPEGIEVREAKYVAWNAPSLSSLPIVAEYRVRPANDLPLGIEPAGRQLRGRELEVERKEGLRRYPVADQLLEVGAEEKGVRLVVRSNPSGGIRVAELIQALDRELGGGLVVAEVTRTRLWVETEGRRAEPLEF